MVQIINLETVKTEPNLKVWQDFAERWKGWRAQFNQHHWPESWQGNAYKNDQLMFPSPWGNRILETRHSIRNGLVFGYVLQEQKQRALLMPGYLGAGHQLEAIYLIREQILLHLPYSLAGSNWFLQVTNILLPELLNQPQVNPEATAAAMQLSIEGHPNFAHCLLNTYTCLEENKREIKSSIKIIGIEPIAPLKDLFPEYQWLKQHEQSDGNEQEFELPISCRPSVISEGLRNRIQEYANNNHPANQIQEHTKTNERIMRWKQNGGWVLWVSLKTRGAVAHGLKEFIVELIKEFESRQCTPMLILDGFSIQHGETSDARYYGLTIQELIAEEKVLAAQIKELLHSKGCTVQIIEAIGLPLLSSIDLARFADFYICHQGSVQHKIGWTYWNTPGIVHSNLTRWRSGIHEWGGMGGKAPTWVQKGAIAEYQDAKNQSEIGNNNPRRPYQINCQFAINSAIESIEQSGLILEFKQVQSESVKNNTNGDVYELASLIHSGFFQEAEAAIEMQSANGRDNYDAYSTLLHSIFFRQVGEQKKAQKILKSHQYFSRMEFNFINNYLQSLLAEQNLEEALSLVSNTIKKLERENTWERDEIQHVTAILNTLSFARKDSLITQKSEIKATSYLLANSSRRWNNPSIIDNNSRFANIAEAVYCPQNKCWYNIETNSLITELLQPTHDYTGYFGGADPTYTVNIQNLAQDAEHLDMPASYIVNSYHFGHFLTQSASFTGAFVLPIRDNRISSDLPRYCLSDTPLTSWAKDIIRYGSQHEIIFRELDQARPLRVKQLILSEQSWIEWNYCHSSHSLIFKNSAKNIITTDELQTMDTNGQKNYYFSRSKVKNGLRSSVNEISLEEELTKLEFEIVHPELLQQSELYGIINNSRIIAGPMGSAMHNILFRTNPNPLTTLNFAHFLPPLNFAMIESCCGIERNIYSRSCEETRDGTEGNLLYFDVKSCLEAVDHALELAR